MLPSDIDRALADLISEEGLKTTVYDDATGEPIGPGTVVKGNPTIGIGRALNRSGITAAEAAALCRNDIDQYLRELDPLLWFRVIDPDRQRAVLNMRHQMGLTGLLRFTQMIDALARQDFAAAAQAALDSKWARDFPARSKRVAALLAGGAATPIA